MPKLSFVIPTHNRIEWLPVALESLRSQTEDDIEIVVVNDGSTDGTREFLDDYAKKDARIKVIHNDVAGGAGPARNRGAEAATSDLIAVCDDDDVYINERAAQTIAWFEKNPASELVSFPYVSIDYFENILEPFVGAAFDHEAFTEKGEVSYYCNPAAAYRKAAAVETGGYKRESEGLTDDYQFLKNWVATGKKVDYCGRTEDGEVPFVTMHRILPDSMMAKIRGWDASWLKSKA